MTTTSCGCNSLSETEDFANKPLLWKMVIDGEHSQLDVIADTIISSIPLSFMHSDGAIDVIISNSHMPNRPKNKRLKLKQNLILR